ncbi:MAG: hypothetical protein WD073_09465 [Xanthobacteraceae bacterium]
MRQLPWITIVIATIAFISPFGRDFVYLAFFSGEQLSRNIAQPFFFIGMAVLIALAVLEWGIKAYIRKRRAKGAASG